MREERVTLRSRAVRGVIGFSALGVVRYVLSFAVQIVFAQLLSPEAFGIVALSTALFTFISLASRWGVDEAVMQDVGLRYVYSTIVWIRVGFAVFLVLLVLAVSPLGRLVYDDLVINALIVFAASNAILIAVSPLRGVANREFKLSQLAAGKLLALMIGAVVGLVLVLQGRGVWGLITFYALQDVFTAVSVVVIAPEYPGIKFNLEAARWFAGFARGMLISKITGTAENQLDDYLIGTIGGTAMLGTYSIAWRLTNAYTTVFQTAVTKGILPTFSRLKDHREKSREGIQFLLRIQSYVVVPLYIFVSLNATDIIVLTFGTQWEAAGPVLGILAIAGILYPIVNTIRQYYYSVGETSAIVRVNVLILVLMAVSIPPAVLWYGAVGAAASMNFVELAALGAFTFGLRSDLEISARETFGPPLIAGLATGGAVLGSTMLPTDSLVKPGLGINVGLIPPEVVTILISGTAVAVVFYGTLSIIAPSRVRDDITVIAEAFVARKE